MVGLRLSVADANTSPLPRVFPQKGLNQEAKKMGSSHHGGEARTFQTKGLLCLCPGRKKAKPPYPTPGTKQICLHLCPAHPSSHSHRDSTPSQLSPDAPRGINLVTVLSTKGAWWAGTFIIAPLA